VNRCIFSGKDIDALKLGVFPGRESVCMEHFIQEAVESDHVNREVSLPDQAIEACHLLPEGTDEAFF